MPTPSILIAPIARGDVELPNDDANDTVPLFVLFSSKLLLNQAMITTFHASNRKIGFLRNFGSKR